MSLIVAKVSSTLAKESLSRFARASTLQYLVSNEALASWFETAEQGALVCELRDLLADPSQLVERALRERRQTHALMPITPLGAAQASAIGALLAAGVRVRPLIVGYDDADAVLHDFLSDDADRGEAASVIASAAVGVTPPDVADIVVGAVYAFPRKTVTRLSGALRTSSRTVERRLAAASMPQASELLAWTVLLHAAWKRQISLWPYKRIANAAGFPSQAAFYAYQRRHLSNAPNAFGFRMDFRDLLDRFVGRLKNCRLIDEAEAGCRVSFTSDVQRELSIHAGRAEVASRGVRLRLPPLSRSNSPLEMGGAE